MCKNFFHPPPPITIYVLFEAPTHADRNPASSSSLFPGLSLNSRGLKSARESGEQGWERNPILTASSPLPYTLWESPHLWANVGTISSLQHFSACSPFQALSVPLLRVSPAPPASKSLSLFSSLFPSQDPGSFYLPWAGGSTTETGPLFLQTYFLNETLILCYKNKVNSFIVTCFIFWSLPWCSLFSWMQRNYWEY